MSLLSPVVFLWWKKNLQKAIHTHSKYIRTVSSNRLLSTLLIQFWTKQDVHSQCLNVSATPIMAMGCQQCLPLTPCWSVLEFWKIKLEKSSSMNWISSLQKSISKLIFEGYTGSKNPVCRTGFFQIDFTVIKYRSTSLSVGQHSPLVEQGVSVVQLKGKHCQKNPLL